MHSSRQITGVALAVVLAASAAVSKGQAPSGGMRYRQQEKLVPVLTDSDGSEQRRIERLEADLARLERRLAEEAAPLEGFDRGSCAPGRGRAGVVAGVELTVLKPRFQGGAEEDAAGDVFEFNMNGAPRTWVGILCDNGSIFRGRYWQFDHTTHPSWADHTVLGESDWTHFMTIEAHTVDLELASDVWLREDWQVELAVGSRYAMFEQSLDTRGGSGALFKRFQAVGPTALVASRWLLSDTGLAVYGSARGSLLVGESTWGDRADLFTTDDVATTFAAQLGFEWSRPLACGGRWYLRFGWEQQMWLGVGTQFNRPGATPATLFDDERPPNHDVAFMGITTALGVVR